MLLSVSMSCAALSSNSVSIAMTFSLGIGPLFADVCCVMDYGCLLMMSELSDFQRFSIGVAGIGKSLKVR